MIREPFSINVVRAIVLSVSCLLGIGMGLGLGYPPWWGAVAGTGFALVIIYMETLMDGFTLRGFSHGTFGMMIGLGCAWLITRTGIFDLPFGVNAVDRDAWQQVYHLVLHVALGFFGAALAIRSDRTDFSFVIPYVQFQQQAVQERPIVLDLEALVDGRLTKLADTGFLFGRVYVPYFVIEDLHGMVGSQVAWKQERGRAGLDNFDAMRRHKLLDATVYEGPISTAEELQDEDRVDQRLIEMSRRLNARLLTTDGTLNRIARIRGITVLNLQDLSGAMRMVLQPGDVVEILLVREGKDEHQAVGYLPDGGMVVVNQARSLIGLTRMVRVSGSMQTSAGRLLFGELELDSKLSRFD